MVSLKQNVLFTLKAIWSIIWWKTVFSVDLETQSKLLVTRDSSHGLRHFLLDNSIAKRPIRRRHLAVRGMQLKFLLNKGHTFRKWCQQKSVGAHVMRRRCRSSLGNARVIRIASTVEEKRSKKKLNCFGNNLKWSKQQQGITPEKISILSQKRVVSSTPAFRISQGILTIWLALVTCKLSDIPSSLLYFRLV